MEHRYERIVAETERHRLTGLLYLPPASYRGSRLSDYLNSPERSFLALTDVEIAPLNGGAPAEHRQFVAVSLSHVVLAMPAEENAG
jgi:hypothetical protein